MLSPLAEGLAYIMNELFGGITYAGIDTDKHRYPIGNDTRFSLEAKHPTYYTCVPSPKSDIFFLGQEGEKLKQEIKVLIVFIHCIYAA